MRSIALPTGPSWILCCFTSPRRRSTSSGTSSISRMPRSLPGSPDSCMNPYSRDLPQKRPDPIGSKGLLRASRGLRFCNIERMTAMRRDLKRLRVALLTGACALVALGNVAHAQQAQDDDDDTFEQRVIKGILGGLGVAVGGAGIDYRERSPLVIPPSMDLPPPGSSAAAAARDPAWPKNPELNKKVKPAAKVNQYATTNDPGTSSRLSAYEMRAGAKPGAGRITDPS